MNQHIKTAFIVSVTYFIIGFLAWARQATCVLIPLNGVQSQPLCAAGAAVFDVLVDIPFGWLPDVVYTILFFDHVSLHTFEFFELIFLTIVVFCLLVLIKKLIRSAGVRFQ